MTRQIQAEPLKRIVSAIFTAADTPPETAEYMAESLVHNNLMGHDSHGVIRVPFYCSQIRSGALKPQAAPRVLKETPTTALVGGSWNFGQVAARYAAEVAIAKAKEANVAAVGLVEMNHVGRLGEFAGMMAQAGMFGMMIVGGWRTPIAGVAPFGGQGRALGTNPYAMAVPTSRHDIVLLDFATTVLAEGKLQVARAKKAPVPLGVVLDMNGQPSTNAEDFYAGGVMLPFGAHKGYGLSLMADLVGGLLAGADSFKDFDNETGAMLFCIKIEAFRPLMEYQQKVDDRIDVIKAVKPAPGVKEVLIPGEPERNNEKVRAMEGIALPDATWEGLKQTASELGLDLKFE